MEFKNLKVKELSCVLWYTPSRKEFQTKKRGTHIIGLQLSGCGIHDLKDQQLILEENSIFFLNQKDDYSVKMKRPGTSLSIHFTTYESIKTNSFCIKIAKTAEPLRLLKIIEAQFTSRYDELQLLSSFYELCAFFNKVYKKKFTPKDKRILNAELYMNTHFRESDCLSIAATESQLSRRRFNDLFRNYYHMTPNQYLTYLKIDYAKKLLLTEYINVSEAATLCGFSDIYYFSKVFKKETGQTPSEFKLENLVR